MSLRCLFTFSPIFFCVELLTFPLFHLRYSFGNVTGNVRKTKEEGNSSLKHAAASLSSFKRFGFKNPYVLPVVVAAVVVVVVGIFVVVAAAVVVVGIVVMVIVEW